jgi:hypothetical protein
VPPPVRAEDITELVGEVDPLVIERIIETGATADDVAEALAAIETELVEGEDRPLDAPPPSPRVTAIRALLEPLFDDDDRMDG